MEQRQGHLNAGGLGPLSFSLNSLVGTNKSGSLDAVNRTLPATNSLNRRLKRKVKDRNALCRSWGPDDEDDNEIWSTVAESSKVVSDFQLVPESTAYEVTKAEFPAVSEELSWDMDDVSPSFVWDLSQFLDQYNELYEWLIQIQVKLYNPSTDKSTRIELQEELNRNTYHKKLFIEQGEKVAAKYPSNNEEISWRLNYLSNKWQQLETSFTPKKGPQTQIEIDLDHEEKVLKSWLCTMEGQIQPITCRLPKGCSVNILQERFKDNQILLKDIGAHGPVLNGVIRQYEAKANKEKKIPRRIRTLENRWHQIYLRSLEWHYYLEGVIANFKETSATCSSDSDDEPVAKCRRLSYSSSASGVSRTAKAWSDYEHRVSDTGSFFEDDYVDVCHDAEQRNALNSDAEKLRLEPMVVDVQVESEHELSMESIKEINGNFLGIEKEKKSEGKSNLTSVSKSSNYGLYEYKFETYEKKRKVKPKVAYRPEDTDEDAEDEKLQRIIDSAIMDQDWLNSNLSDSEESAPCQSPDDHMDTESEKSAAVEKPAESLKILIKGAEQLVRSRRSLQPLQFDSVHMSKQQRIKQWLSQQRDSHHDSCDASGEWTTGESDIESNSSDKDHFKRRSGSALTLDRTLTSEFSYSTPKHALLRGTKRRQGDRPWSITDISHIPIAHNPQELEFLKMCMGDDNVKSSSETAKAKDSSEDTNIEAKTPIASKEPPKEHTMEDTSKSFDTPSTIVETPTRPHQSNSLKRKKKLRRKSNISLGRKTNSDDTSQRRSSLGSNKFDISTDECEEGPKVTGKAEEPAIGANRIKTRTTHSDGGGQEDSLSEQAWDPYQDLRYLSEPYSETVDSDAARKLFEFGDDYRKYMESEGSSVELKPRLRRRGQPTAQYLSTDIDSDSDVEFIHKMMESSRSQLEEAQNRIGSVRLSVLEVISAMATNNIEALQKFIADLQKQRIGLEVEMKEAQGLLRRWEVLQAEAVERQRQINYMHSLQTQMKNLQSYLENATERCDSFKISSSFESSHLKSNLKGAKELAAELLSRREEMQSLKGNVDEFNVNMSLTSSLASDMEQLQRLWEETNNKILDHVGTMEKMEEIWRSWQDEKSGLEAALEQDANTLKVLDKAIQNGAIDEAMTSNAHSVAKLLNEKKVIQGDLVTANKLNSLFDPKKSRIDESDSGTSGYESCSSDDLSERERRLAHLKRLARDLEATLIPGSKAWKEITETIFEAEGQLCALQKQCNELLIRTAEKLEPSMQDKSISTIRKQENKDDNRKRSRWRRTLWRTVVPLQAALLILVCVALLVEPKCCDSVNRIYNFFGERHDRGPLPT